MRTQIVKKAIEASEGHKACLKQSVYAMVETVDGDIVYGSNKMLNEVSSCPRDGAGCASGEGYDMCKTVCNQNAHAEVDAMQAAEREGYDLEGAKLTLVGHTYCCENCTNEMLSRNIARVEILDPDGKIDVVLDLTTLAQSVLDDKLLNTTPKPHASKVKKQKKNTRMNP